MGESLQEYFWVQDFEVDLTQNVNLKMLNLEDYDAFWSILRKTTEGY